METPEKDTPAKILIVDDQQKNIQVLGGLLKDQNYIIGVAMDGKQAIDTLEKSPDYDLVLLDINMPVMNGYEACAAIRKNKDLTEIPVIFLTAMTDEESILKGFNAGGQDYVTKPFNSKELLSRVKTHLELKQSKDKLKNVNKWLEEKVKERTEELHKANEKLKTTNKELEELEVVKNDFLYIISHEINTPLNGIMGFINILKDELKTSELIEFVNQLEVSAIRLLSFSKLSLRITEIRTRKSDFEKTSINFSQLIGVVKFKSSKEYKKKNIQLRVPNDTDTTTINGDPALITHCIENIVKNAWEHSPENSEVYIKLETTKDKVICAITDEGEGFSEYALTTLFKLFTSDKEYVDNNKGLGLALSKLIMDVHQGKIEAENNPEKGATIKLIFDKPA